MVNLHEVDWTTIPAPKDEGDAEHLTDSIIPNVVLTATSGEDIDLAELTGLSIVYAYPMTGRPDVPLPEGWDMIPGARGCTPQSCGFRDQLGELTELGVNQVFGLSTQETDYQQEAVTRLHLPFTLLSDSKLNLQRALRLPVITVQEMTLLKRLTMIIVEGRITKIFYPVFPPDESAVQVIEWLRNNH